MDDEEGQPERKLKEVLDDFLASCNNYLSIVRTYSSGIAGGKTRLDKERLNLCIMEVVSGIFHA